jgi:hypothetical protein
MDGYKNYKVKALYPENIKFTPQQQGIELYNGYIKLSYENKNSDDILNVIFSAIGENEVYINDIINLFDEEQKKEILYFIEDLIDKNFIIKLACDQD